MVVWLITNRKSNIPGACQAKITSHLELGEKCLMRNFKAITRLYFIHIFAFLAVGISTYYPPWDIILSLLYLLVISHTTIWDLSNYAYFIMLFWYTALVPMLSLLPGVLWRGWPLYYYFLLALPFIMLTYHFILSSKILITNK